MPTVSGVVTGLLGIARRHSIALLALFLAMGGTAAAVTSRSGGNKRVYACVARNGELTLSSAKKPCAPGHRKISWQGEGLQGETGPQGATGSRGARGATGVAGSKGDTGPKGDTGASGAQGSKGDTGATGAIGPQGPAGPNGTNGTNGTNGAAGNDGNDGAPGPGSFISSSPVALTTDGAGNPAQTALLPLSGVLDSNTTDSVVVTQAVPSTLTFTGMEGRFTTTTAQNLIGTTVTLTARLFSGRPGATFLAPTALSCTGSPPLTALIPVGTVVNFSCTGGAVPYPTGWVGYVEVSSQATGLAVVTAVQGEATVSLAAS